MESWWDKRDTYIKLQDFHEKYARQPNLDAIRPQHDQIITSIRDQLQRERKCINLIYTGSAYEGVQIDNNYDFDVTFVMDGSGIEIRRSSESAEHFVLNAGESFRWGTDNRIGGFLSSSFGNREIVPERFISTFAGTLQTIINQRGYERKIKLRYHGPAIQMDVTTPSNGMYSVDMVPSFQVGGRNFVAKPIKGQIGQRIQWRESFAREESEFFRRLSQGNCCHKKIIRILKAIRSREDPLKSLTSYHFKTSLMYLCEQNSSRSHWEEKNLVHRLMEMLGFLEEALRIKHLSHKFIPQVNLFESMSRTTSENMYNWIKRVRRNEQLFLSKLA